MIRHFAGRFPEDPIPPDQPIWLVYEVDVENDDILRSVELFADGRVERNSIEIEARHGFPVPSLTDQPFMECVGEAGLETIPGAEFEDLWEQGVDTPFWAPGAFNSRP